MIELRYSLLAYIYSAFWQYSHSGTPMITPVSWLSPNDKTALSRNEEFMLGENLLIKTVSIKKIKSTKVYLPEGRWYSWWNGKRSTGGKKITVDTPMDQFPFFVKAGAVVPIRPVMQFVDEIIIEALGMKVFYETGNHSSSLYEDSGKGMNYKKGIFSLKKFICRGTESELIITQRKTGKYRPTYKKYEIEVAGLPFIPKNIRIDDLELEFSFRTKSGNLKFMAPPSFRKIEIN